MAITVTILLESADLNSEISHTARLVYAPLQRGAIDLVSPIARIFANGSNYGALQSENERLEKTIGDLRMQSSERGFESQQLEELHGLEHISFSRSPTVIAQTINNSLQGFTATFDIDKGTSSGVAPGMPVVTADGLVGQVVLASRSRSNVRLIVDGASKVGVNFSPAAICQGQPCTGIAYGQGPGDNLQINFVPPGTSLHKGQLVTTDGLSASSFPGGIPVAKIVSAKKETGAPQETVEAKPLANLNHNITYVAVLQWEPCLNPTVPC